MPILFKSLSQNEKVEFFIHCQELMLKYHPKSSFVIREGSLDKALEVFQDNINKYQGYYYSNDNICVLWNKIAISDPINVKRVIKESAYQPPSEHYSGVSIDFATFKNITDVKEFIIKNDEERIKYVLFIKEGKPKIYKKDEIINRLPASR